MMSESIKNTEEGSYFVISDTHLGSNTKGGNVPDVNALCQFLEWINELKLDDKILVQKNNSNGENCYEKSIVPPSKIILLGDILDLWDTENGDRSNVIKEAAKPFALLQSIKCDKIYVVGNHDQDLYELADILKEERLKGKKESHLNLGSCVLEVHKRHYPEKVDCGKDIGGKKYAFIHGQQYDRVQITEWISKKFKIRFDPLDFIQDISNVSWIKSIFRKKIPTVVYIGSVFLIVYLYSLGWIGRTMLTVLLTFAAIPPLVKTITRIQNLVWKLVKPKDKTVEQVIENGSYYKKGSDHMNADVVVFGHTHMPGSYYLKEKNRLFINTGAWLKANDNRKVNTFAYIDNKGIDVLSWVGEKKKDTYVFEEVCSHRT